MCKLVIPASSVGDGTPIITPRLKSVKSLSSGPLPALSAAPPEGAEFSD